MTNHKRINEGCAFCNEDTIKDGLLDETENFYYRVAAKGAIAPGHVLLISKDHFSCFGEMPSILYKEYSVAVYRIKNEIKKNFSTAICVELGVHGQSIPHAHTHFFPFISEWYDFSNKKFIDFIPKEILVTQGKGIEDIHKIFEQEGQYVAIEENDQLYICHTKGYEGTLRPVREFPSRLTGLTHFLHWKTMPESEKRKNEEWINHTIQTLKRK